MEDLPAELVYQICENLDLQDLLKLRQTSSRINEVCHKVILDKEIEYIKYNKYKIKIKALEEDIIHSIRVDRSFGRIYVKVHIDKGYVTQVINVPKPKGKNIDPDSFKYRNMIQSRVPWILPDIPYTDWYEFELKQIRRGTKNNNMTAEILLNLIKQGYKIL